MENPIQAPVESTGISDEKRQELIYAANRLKAQVEDTQMRIKAAGYKKDVEAKSSLKGIFDRMQLAGVDLNSRESVNGYIERLRQNNPETAAMFEKSMYFLLDAQNNNMNDRNQNEALPKGPRGYIE